MRTNNIDIFSFHRSMIYFSIACQTYVLTEYIFSDKQRSSFVSRHIRIKTEKSNNNTVKFPFVDRDVMCVCVCVLVFHSVEEDRRASGYHSQQNFVVFQRDSQ
jgi:hypothetical protein